MFALETIRTEVIFYSLGKGILVGVSINNMCLDEYGFEIRYFIKMVRRYWLKRLSNIILYFLIKTFDILNRYHRQICNLSGSLPMQLSPAQNTDKTEMLLYFINVEKNRCFCYTQKQRK